MIGLLWFVVAVLASPFRSKLRLEAENAMLTNNIIAAGQPGAVDYGDIRVYVEALSLGIFLHDIPSSDKSEYGCRSKLLGLTSGHLRDRDRAYGEIFVRRVRSIGIRDRPTSSRSPWQNAYAERLIGSIQRECIDHVVVFGERHLRHVPHLSLNKGAPVHRGVEWAGNVVCRPILGRLHHQYGRT
jgi:hypothetical protein